MRPLSKTMLRGEDELHILSFSEVSKQPQREGQGDLHRVVDGCSVSASSTMSQSILIGVSKAGTTISMLDFHPSPRNAQPAL